MAAYRPDDRPRQGGARPKGCPEHPTADLIIRSTTHCAECDRQLGDVRETLRPQVAGVGQTPRPLVIGVTHGLQAAAVESDTMVDDVRAAKLVAITVGATRLHRYDEPVRRNPFRHDRERLLNEPALARCGTSECGKRLAPGDADHCARCQARRC